jgi:energy-coupling factor transporter ATP-binding protein EcfA2
MASSKLIPKPRLPNVTLLLGDNGSGKTTVLRALAAAAFGPTAKDLLRDSSLVRFGESRGRIVAKLLLHEQDRASGQSIYSDLMLGRIGERLQVTFGSSNFEREMRFAFDDSKNFERAWNPIYESENDAFFIVGTERHGAWSVSIDMIRERAPIRGRCATCGSGVCSRIPSL